MYILKFKFLKLPPDWNKNLSPQTSGPQHVSPSLIKDEFKCFLIKYIKHEKEAKAESEHDSI